MRLDLLLLGMHLHSSLQRRVLLHRIIVYWLPTYQHSVTSFAAQHAHDAGDARR